MEPIFLQIVVTAVTPFVSSLPAPSRCACRLRTERNEFREELNQLRKELHDLRAAACTELRQLYDEYAARLAEIYRNKADAFCELRDNSCAEIEERLARLAKAKEGGDTVEEPNLIESDSVALMKGRDNSLSWLPVYLDADNKPFVKGDGAWLSVSALEGFQRWRMRSSLQPGPAAQEFWTRNSRPSAKAAVGVASSQTRCSREGSGRFTH